MTLKDTGLGQEEQTPGRLEPPRGFADLLPYQERPRRSAGQAGWLADPVGAPTAQWGCRDLLTVPWRRHAKA